jgi:hypothetical protein
LKEFRSLWKQARKRGRPVYLLYAEHDRFPGKPSFHGPRFLDSPGAAFSLEKLRVFNKSLPLYDPGYWVCGFLKRAKKRRIMRGFLGYPVFPDMIDDVGVQYAPWSQRLFVCYRLIRVDDPGRIGVPVPPRPVDSRDSGVASLRMAGLEIRAEGERLTAFRRTDDGAYRRVCTARDLNVLLKAVESNLDPLEIGRRQQRIGLVAGNVRGFNMIRCDDLFYAIPMDEGAFERARVRTGDYSRSFVGISETEVRRKIAKDQPLRRSTGVRLVQDGYGEFNILEMDGTFYGVRRDAGGFNVKRLRKLPIGIGVTGSDLKTVKQKIDALVRRANAAGPLEANYRGYRIIQFGDRYYGIRQADGAFDVERYRNGNYRDAVDGADVPAVKRRINAISTTAAGERTRS